MRSRLFVLSMVFGALACGGSEAMSDRPEPDVVTHLVPSGLEARGPGEASDQYLARSSFVAPTADGGVMVSDRQDPKVLVLGEDLEPINTIGRAGRGPAEFESPRMLHVDAEGVLTVIDVGVGRISQFSSDDLYLGGRSIDAGTTFALLDSREIVLSSPDPTYLLNGFRGDTVTNYGVFDSLPEPLRSYSADERVRGDFFGVATWPGEARALLLVDLESFRIWKVVLGEDAPSVSLLPIPIPSAVVELALDARDVFRDAMAGGVGWVPAIRSYRVLEDGTVWIMPLSRDVIGMRIDPDSGDTRVVWASEANEISGLTDGFIEGDALTLLYRTEVRRYALEPRPSPWD